MPGPPMRPDYFGSFLRSAIDNGTIAESVLDDKVRIVGTHTARTHEAPRERTQVY